MEDKAFQSEIEKLTRQIQIQNSLKRNFVVAVLRGFGTALGATAVFGLVLALLLQIVVSIDYVPILNNILSSQAVEELIRRFTLPQ